MKAVNSTGTFIIGGNYLAERIRALNFRWAPRQQACMVCGRYKQISQLHHIIPVAQMVAYLVDQDLLTYVVRHKLYLAELHLPLAWLCPNHHKILHDLYSGWRAALEDVTDNETAVLENLRHQNHLPLIKEKLRAGLPRAKGTPAFKHIMFVGTQCNLMPAESYDPADWDFNPPWPIGRE